MTSIPTHTSMMMGVVQDMFCSLNRCQGGHPPPANTLYQERGAYKDIRMMTLYPICSFYVATKSTRGAWSSAFRAVECGSER